MTATRRARELILESVATGLTVVTGPDLDVSLALFASATHAAPTDDKGSAVRFTGGAADVRWTVIMHRERQVAP